MSLEDIMDHGHPLPLGIYFFLAAQAESFNADHFGDVGEYRLDGTESPAVDCPAFVGIDLLFHAFEHTGFLFLGFSDEDVELARRFLMGLLEAFRFQWTVGAVFFVGLELHESVMADGRVDVLQPQCLSRRTDAGLFCPVNTKVGHVETLFGL